MRTVQSHPKSSKYYYFVRLFRSQTRISNKRNKQTNRSSSFFFLMNFHAFGLRYRLRYKLYHITRLRFHLYYLRISSMSLLFVFVFVSLFFVSRSVSFRFPLAQHLANRETHSNGLIYNCHTSAIHLAHCDALMVASNDYYIVWTLKNDKLHRKIASIFHSRHISHIIISWDDSMRFWNVNDATMMRRLKWNHISGSHAELNAQFLK